MSDDDMFVAALAWEPAPGAHMVDGWGRGGAAARPSSGAWAALQGLRRPSGAHLGNPRRYFGTSGNPRNHFGASQNRIETISVRQAGLDGGQAEGIQNITIVQVLGVVSQRTKVLTNSSSRDLHETRVAASRPCWAAARFGSGAGDFVGLLFFFSGRLGRPMRREGAPEQRAEAGARRLAARLTRGRRGNALQAVEKDAGNDRRSYI